MPQVILVNIAVAGLLIANSLTVCAPQACKFSRGQFVYSVLGNRRGQVLKCDFVRHYLVRFPANTASTDTHFASLDGALQAAPYVIVDMREMELSAQPVKP